MPLPFLIGAAAALASGAAAAGTAVAGTAAAIGTAAAAGAATVGTAAAAGAATVGTAAAAGAATVGTAAAAAGTAVAGAAAAAGTAATGAVAAAGTAVASTTVGSAAIGAMGAVGAGVGTAAGALSSAPVIGAAATTVASMANTAAGAAAVGTIATTGTVGAVNAVSAAGKMLEAGDIKDSALSEYDSEKVRFDAKQSELNSLLEELGKSKLKIWGSFERFSTMYSKIQNPPVMEADVKRESLALTVEELNNIRAVAIAAKDLMVGGIASVSAGNLIGLATSGGLLNSITVASTGTAITSLSGAAATNATLAALGGGAIKAGGAGIAGGTAALSGLALAPTLMISGIMLNSKAGKALENAKDIKAEVKTAIEKMRALEEIFEKIEILSSNIRVELENLYRVYNKLINTMEQTVRGKTDYRTFTILERRNLEKTILALKLLKKLSTQNILKDDQKEIVLDDQVEQTYTLVSAKRKKEFSTL